MRTRKHLAMISSRPKILFLLAVSLLLSACAVVEPTVPQTAPSEEEIRQAEIAAARLDAAELAYHDQSERVAQRLRAACVSPEHHAYYAKTACLPSGITPKMLEDRTRITRAQQTAARAVFEITNALSAQTREVMVQTGLPEYIALAERSKQAIDPQVRAMQEGLLSGKLTWGQYNQLRLELAQAWPTDAAEPEDEPEDAPEDAADGAAAGSGGGLEERLENAP